jgi:ribosomal protein S18 acetylase RimI-like enzyme
LTESGAASLHAVAELQGSMTIRRWNSREALPWALLLDADPSRAEVLTYLAPGELWVVDRKGQTLGAIVLMPRRGDVLEIMNMATDAEYRRCGIGTSLLRKAMARAEQLGAKWLHVGTGSTSYAQLQFYQRFDFRVHSVDRGFFIGRYAGEAQEENGVVLKDMIRLQMAL